MFNKTLAAGLLLSGLIYSAPAMAQSALAQQAATQQSTPTPKSSTAKSVKPATPKPTSKPAAAAKKSPPKPLVYVQDNRSSNKAEAPAAGKSSDASGNKSEEASVKKASATSSAKTTPSATPKPLSADLTKAFAQNCPSVALTDTKSKAVYDVTFEREPGSKGVKSAFGLTSAVHKTSRIEVMNRSGKELFSETGHSTSQLVKDACTAIGTPVTKMAKK